MEEGGWCGGDSEAGSIATRKDCSPGIASASGLMEAATMAFAPWTLLASGLAAADRSTYLQQE